METKFKLLQKKLFEDTREGRNVLIVDGADRAGELLMRVAAGWSEALKQPALLLTHRVEFWRKALPAVSGSPPMPDPSKSCTNPSFVVFEGVGSDTPEIIFERIKRFHDDALTSPDDARLFRLFYDCPFPLSVQFLFNLRSFSRRSNLCCWALVAAAGPALHAFFDMVLALERPAGITAGPLALTRVLKAEDYSGFEAPAETLRPGTCFLLCCGRDGSPVFKDIDYTEIV